MFTWSPFDMPDINPNIICHWLHVNPANKPVVQKRRNFVLERVAIIKAKIDKLLAAGFIKEVSYSEWLGNVVLVVEQENGNWRVCIDYTDLNKACPKDKFLMSFGLNNARATYQRLVDKIFNEQLGKTMEVYVDDMLVKDPKRADHIKNLTEAFSLL
ncbi:hypothetical protein L3X38_037630 [Prunus dulcis]|uniref:Reverse transcriptase domain-containing protein n=1 Tax=Prunus dulcis TaxID=3755 RepID=A0AAD4V4X0_PRUDU|nr:hypothetical protein L3X38_037630 [Prunus dulcis]